ncbi:MAG: SDR family oxidoreductase [Pseudomonadota bacterium]
MPDNLSEATLITGGSNGIGAAIVAARLAMGECVLSLDLAPPAEKTAARHYQVDLSDEEALRQVMGEISGAFAVTRVVNCAGAALLDPLESLVPDDLRRTMDLNVLAPALIVQACLPAMKARRFGRIVNIASRAALGKTLRTAYAGSKGALISATRVWALEHAADGITVNAIGPGPIETELFARANPPDSPATQMIRGTIPVGRLGQPAEIAHAADFFLDDKAGFVTGQVLYVCGGMTIGVAPT